MGGGPHEGQLPVGAVPPDSPQAGKLKAVVAVCHSVLVIAYHVLKDKRPYRDLGADYFDRLDTERIQRHHVNRLKALGYEVELKPRAA